MACRARKYAIPCGGYRPHKYQQQVSNGPHEGAKVVNFEQTRMGAINYQSPSTSAIGAASFAGTWYIK
jgi:hypothetical protein